MAVAISILCGVHDVHLWLLIFAMHSVGMFLGLILEFLPQTEKGNSDDEGPNGVKFSSIRKITYWLGTASICTPWLVLFCYFFKATTGDGSGPPDFVYAAFLGTFVLFSTFGINSFCCHILKLYDFHRAEMIYCILSFTAKTFLAADVFGGLNASSDDDGSR